jgi:hypothetical protein
MWSLVRYVYVEIFVDWYDGIMGIVLGYRSIISNFQIFSIILICVGVKVPTSTNALVELMNMVERWRQRTDYGPVVVVSQDGISR